MPEGAGIRSSFVKLSSGAAAALYEPESPGDNARVAFMFMHPDGNFISHIGCSQLAQRGFRALGVNTRFANMPGPTGGPYVYHEVIPDVSAGVEHLRSLAGVETVVLAGHSGGGPLFSAYQNLAENGAGVFQGGHLLTEGPDSLGGLPPADALVLLDAHVGYGAHALLMLDASIVDESQPAKRDPDLDMFESRNGWGPDGATYSSAFVADFTAAQAARMARLVSYAEERVAAIDAGRGDYPDDEPMVVPGLGTRIWSPDTSLLAHTVAEWPLLRADGSTPVQVVPSVRPPSGKPIDHSGYSGALVTSVRRFLATHAIRTLPDYSITADHLTGIDWHSTYTSAPANLEGVTVPLLSLVMSAHYFLVPNEVNFAHAASTDKEMAMVEGAVHGMTPCTAVEQYPRQFGDTVKTTFDHVAAWTGGTVLSTDREAVPSGERPEISVMLAVPDAPAAARWYTEALGASELWNLGSVIGLQIAGAAFFLHEQTGEGFDSPAELGATTTRVEVFLDDPDPFVDRALAAGASPRPGAVVDHAMPWGNHRQGGFIDPAGHVWSVGDRSPLAERPV